MGGKEIAQLGLVLYEEDIHTKYELYSLILLQFHSKYVFFCHRYDLKILPLRRRVGAQEKQQQG